MEKWKQVHLNGDTKLQLLYMLEVVPWTLDWSWGCEEAHGFPSCLRFCLSRDRKQRLGLKKEMRTLNLAPSYWSFVDPSMREGQKYIE